ncbi:MAG: hypothetical protein ACIAQZ_16125 [Sedimentisphaeraceae bacterium JB056]
MSIIGLLFCILLITEWYLWEHWNLLYFNTGCMLYRQTLAPESEFNSTAKGMLSRDGGNVASYGNLRLKRKSDTEIVIRKKRFLTLPVRGKVVFDENGSQHKVCVYIHWYALYIYLFVAIEIGKDIFSHPILVFAGLFGWTTIMYFKLIDSLLKEIGITKFDPW